MGYDMYWDEEPAEVREAYAQVLEVGDELAYRRWTEAQQSTHSYWRESIWSMGRFRALLDALGCIDNTKSDIFNAPRMESDADHDDRKADKVQMYRLIDNSGWVVSEHQCSKIVEAMEPRLADPVEAMELIFAYAEEEMTSINDMHEGVLNALSAALGTDALVSLGGAKTPSSLQTRLEYAAADLPDMLKFFKGAATHGGFVVS